MNCERYKEWIEEAALGALDASRRAQLDGHLAACSRCRDAFEAARSLFAAIDQGVAVSVEGKPSADFAARVRMGLAEERARAPLGSRWSPVFWIPVFGTAALALVLLGFWVARRPQGVYSPGQQARTAAPQSTGPTATTPEQAKVVPPPVEPAHSTRTPPRSTRASRSRGAACCARGSQAPQLQVQIQPGQWAAVTSLYRAGKAGEVGATEQPVPADKPLQVAPVEVLPLVIAELQDPKPVGSAPETTYVQDR